jgi:DNA repair protein RadA/Sms
LAKADKQVYVCSNCGNESPKWVGKCGACGEWNTYVEFKVQKLEELADEARSSEEVEVFKLQEVVSKPLTRMATGSEEFDRVLGGGLVSAQVVLISGEPGVGKSTLLMQLTHHFSTSGHNVVYVAGEESPQQIAMRAQRLFPGDKWDIDLISEPNLDSVIPRLAALRPQLVIVDSIQTVFTRQVSGVAGGLSQIKACTAELVRAAKRNGYVLVIVGHINKSGVVAGPKVLEHLVDTVLQFEGDGEFNYRLLRSDKNRFGPAAEVGIFSMGEKGLQDMNQNDLLFTSGEEGSVGVAKTVQWEGSRPVVVEVQALVQDTVFPYPKRVAEGVPLNRVQLIAAILDKYLKVKLVTKDIYVRTVNNYKLNSAQTDMAIAAAIISSAKGVTVSSGTVFVGELGLNGHFKLATVLAERSAKFASAQKLDVITPAKRALNLPSLAKLIS